MTSHSVRSRRKSTNLPQRARARGARALPSLSLRPRRRLLNYYSHLPLPLIKLARPAAAATAAASSRVAYTLTGFFKSKLITISREQRHSHARADLGGEKQQERSKGLTGKSIFHQSIVHPLAPSRRRVDGRPTDGQLTEQNRQSRSFCCIFCRRLFRSGSRRFQWMSERPWTESVKWRYSPSTPNRSLMSSGALFVRFSFFPFFCPFFGVHCAIVV